MTINWLTAWSKTWRRYPIAVFGFQQGPVRCETIGGGDWFVNNALMTIMAMQKPIQADDGKTYAVTHLQKKSRFGLLVMWPFCVHVWITFRFQQQRKSDGDVMVDIPGSEFVPYLRAGVARWDAHDGKWICPTLYGGLHWD